ncbi:MAG: hypothetical protein WCA12_09590 [Burkholderiales bacterium]
MDLNQLLMLEDQPIVGDGDSLLETAFPDDFYVIGADGAYMTTPNNYEIFQRALDLIDEGVAPESPEFRREVEGLLEEADELSQDDYDEAYERSLVESEGDDEDEEWDDA